MVTDAKPTQEIIPATVNRIFTIEECPECERFPENHPRRSWCLNGFRDIERSNGWRMRQGMPPLGVFEYKPETQPKQESLPSLSNFLKPACGTELKEFLKELSINAEWCESCEQWEALMNSWGPFGCEKMESKIEARLIKAEADSNLNFKERLTIGWNLLKTIGPFDPLHPHLSIVREVVRRCKIKEQLFQASQLLAVIEIQEPVEA